MERIMKKKELADELAKQTGLFSPCLFSTYISEPSTISLALLATVPTK